MQYGGGSTTCTSHDVTRFSNFTIQNLHAQSVLTVYTIIGLKVVDDPMNPNPITGLVLENVTVDHYNSIGACHYANVTTKGKMSPALHVGVGCSVNHGALQSPPLLTV